MSKGCMKNFLKQTIGIMFLKTTGLAETASESQDILYIFPNLETETEQTVLFLMRGAFLTLNHILPDILGSRPVR